MTTIEIWENYFLPWIGLHSDFEYIITPKEHLVEKLYFYSEKYSDNLNLNLGLVCTIKNFFLLIEHKIVEGFTKCEITHITLNTLKKNDSFFIDMVFL